MFATFLPSQVNQLQDVSAIALIRSIERVAIATPLTGQSIVTAYVHQGKRQGQGEIPLLLLHGFDSSVLEFRSLLPLLSAENETWAVDLLGFGFTERVKGINFGPDAIKTHLYSFWQTLIDQPVTLVGASMGGAAAIDFTLTYPKAVHQLVLINSIGYTTGPAFKQFLFPPLDYLAVEYLRQRKLLALSFGSSLGNLYPTMLEAVRCAALHLEMPGWYEAILHHTRSGGYDNLARKIAQIDKPTLILWGEADDVLAVGDAEKFQRAIVHSQLHKLKCGHAPQLEQPQATARHILAFRS